MIDILNHCTYSAYHGVPLSTGLVVSAALMRCFVAAVTLHFPLKTFHKLLYPSIHQSLMELSIPA